VYLCRLGREFQTAVPREFAPSRQARLTPLTTRPVRGRAGVLDDAILRDQVIQERRIVKTERLVVSVQDFTGGAGRYRCTSARPPADGVGGSVSS